MARGRTPPSAPSLPIRSATSAARCPQMPLTPTRQASPGSRRLSRAVSSAACPEPLTASVRLFLVWNMYWMPCLMSSMIWRRAACRSGPGPWPPAARWRPRGLSAAPDGPPGTSPSACGRSSAAPQPPAPVGPGWRGRAPAGAGWAPTGVSAGPPGGRPAAGARPWSAPSLPPCSLRNVPAEVSARGASPSCPAPAQRGSLTPRQCLACVSGPDSRGVEPSVGEEEPSEPSP